MYRVWYSTESFADFIIDHTSLKSSQVVKARIYESDANNPRNFHTMPDHIRKILYLDAPDIIVEKENEPVFTVEVSTEAGTGHNAFQRFARIAASVENEVPAFYIYPEGAIITRSGVAPRWDMLNPLVFKALEDVMNIYGIPALLYYYPSDIRNYPNPNAARAPHIKDKGLRHDPNIVKYAGCPDAHDPEMGLMFAAMDQVINSTTQGVLAGRSHLLQNTVIRQRRSYMNNEFAAKAQLNGMSPAAQLQRINGMSPLSAVIELDTIYLLNYLAKYQSANYRIGDLLKSRDKTVFYKVNAKFRGDPYPGALAAIDYLLCREGKTYEDRRSNLVLVFGDLVVNQSSQTLNIGIGNGATINDFVNDVINSESKNLLTRTYNSLRNYEIPRYFMQARYGSTYSKAKHIRVYSYFADAILFPDGSLWRDG